MAKLGYGCRLTDIPYQPGAEAPGFCFRFEQKCDMMSENALEVSCMNIRPSQPGDLPALVDLFGEARGTIAQLGIDQWQNGYPSEKVITEDIEKSQSYVVEQEGGILGTFVLVTTEPTYDLIYEGQWQDETYLAIHRVAVKVASRGTGVADRIIRYATEQAQSMGREALRIDTHRGNLPMRRMLEKQGFQYRGVIYLTDGAPRVAYEKRVR